jgi:hypothetical protein
MNFLPFVKHVTMGELGILPPETAFPAIFFVLPTQYIHLWLICASLINLLMKACLIASLSNPNIPE